MSADRLPPPVLVIGYGNTLRQDDGAGVIVADTIAARGLPDVIAVGCAQLGPEHAEAVARAETVVFVDADASPAEATQLLPIRPAASSRVTNHALAPGVLLALARDLYGHAGSAWLLTVPAERFGFGSEISDVTRRGIDAAVDRLEEAFGHRLRSTV